MSTGKYSNDSPILAAAIELAARGFKVLPVCPSQTGCGSKTCRKGKHPLPQHWEKVASSNEAIIRTWFKKYPAAGVGIATGPGSGVFVIDTDGEQGDQSLKQLMNEHDWQPNTLTATTGKGKHFYLRYPSVKVITRSKIAPSLDVRGHGGFVVAPPSQHVNGNQYRWIDANAAIAEAPDWLVKLVSERKNVTNIKVKTAHVENLVINQGDRHRELLSIAGGLRANGTDDKELLEHLQAVNRDACKPPLSAVDVSRIAVSAANWEVGRKYPSYTERRAERETPLPWFPLFVRDWLGDSDLLLMNSEQRGWYFMLVMEAWKGRGILENDPAALRRLARAESQDAFEHKQDAVLGKFDSATDDDGKPILVHRIIATLWEKQHKNYMATVKAGQASARKRAAEKQPEMQVAA